MARINREFRKNKFASALFIDQLFSSRARRVAALLLNVFIIFPAFALLYKYIAENTTILPIPYVINSSVFAGMIYLALSLRFVEAGIDCFINSKTYDKNGDQAGKNFFARLNYYASEIIFYSLQESGNDPSAIIGAASKTKTGLAILLRIGFNQKEFQTLEENLNAEKIASTEQFLSSLSIAVKDGLCISAGHIFVSLYRQSEQFRTAVIKKNLSEDDLFEIASWAEKTSAKEDMDRRFWRWEVLGRVPGFARNLAYGEIYLLEEHARELREEAESEKHDLIGRAREIELLESALLKNEGANIVLIGEPGSGRHAVLSGLVKMISGGKIFPELEHKRVFELDAESLVASAKTKGEIEELIIRVFNEAVRAGNIILAIDNFPEFTRSLASFSISASELLGPYLGHSSIHIIALADKLGARRTLETEAGLMKFFEKVEIADLDQKTLTEILENITIEYETRSQNIILLTFAALKKISEGALNYLVEGGVIKRAIELIEETINEARLKNKIPAGEEIVLEILSRKTKMPLGEIKEDEKEKLLVLETLLEKRVINQKEATSKIAAAIRRARAGIRNTSRPIGSFLFLGPTGVGKTETAKTLAEVYFGNVDAMTRFDMSEYQGEDGLTRLTGSFEKNEPGILASRMKANPYGLLLFDEFEKANETVRNLFLQILDEGFFSDYTGSRINMRSAIIIATSNAGSELIWQMVQAGENQVELDKKISAHIREKKILSPELLNRFDAVVIFRPLASDALLKISRIMLQNLQERLKKQNFMLELSDPLITAVAQGGYDPSMGARPMQRFIQDKIEKIISEKIIKGEIAPGKTFSFSAEDLK